MKKLLVRWELLPEGKWGRKELLSHFGKKGWRWLVLVVAFYAVRDVVLYLLMPYLMFKALTGF